METFYSILCGLPLSPWLSACARGDWKAVQALLRRCPKLLKERGPLGYTALHYAAEQGNTEACRFLLEEGANLLVPDVLGEYPPHKAIRQGAGDTAAYLNSYAHQHAVAGKGKGLDWFWVMWLSENLWKSSLCFEACQAGDWATVKKLFEQGLDITALGPDENTVLHCAAEQGNTEACVFLLRHGADVHAENICAETPLHCAAEKGHREAFKLLASHTKDLPEGLLHSAVRGGHRGMVELLLEAGLPVDSLNDGDNTALGIAVSYGYRDIAALLLKWGANIHAPYLGYPLVYRAINNPPLLRFLQRKGADVHRLTQNGESLLFAVAQGIDKDDIKIFERLLRMGLSPLIKNSTGKSLLHRAVIYKPLKFVKYLVEDLGIPANLRDDEGHTALQHLRLYRPYPDVEEYLESILG